MKDNEISTVGMDNINIVPLNNDINNLASQIVNEPDIDKTKDLVSLFNWNLSKKNAVRLLKLSGLYDKITDQMIERFQKRSGEFSNSDLLNYLQTIENSIEKTQKGLSSTEQAPALQVQNNTVNFNILETFDSDSKERISDAIKAILKKADNGTDYPTCNEYQDNTDESQEDIK